MMKLSFRSSPPRKWEKKYFSSASKERNSADIADFLNDDEAELWLLAAKDWAKKTFSFKGAKLIEIEVLEDAFS